MDTIERPADEIDYAVAVLRRAGLVVFEPRRSPTDRAEEAIEQMGFNLVSLSDAMAAGAVLSEQKRVNLAAFVTMLKRIGAVE